MPERVLVAILDPHRPASRLVPRLRYALGGGGETHERGALAVGWTGPSLAARHPLQVVDGDAASLAPGWPAAREALCALRGRFALITWDGERGFAARDHFGVRPLFFAEQDGVLHVASEVGALLALLPRRPAPDHGRLALWLAGRSPGDVSTLYSGVAALPPAHALVFERRGWRVERYWRPQPREGLEDADGERAAAALRDGIRSAVSRSCANEDRTGVLLSGGLDSSVVLACADANARESARPAPRAFSAVFPERPELDERRYIAAAVERAGVTWASVDGAGHALTPAAMAFLERWELPLQSPALGVFGRVRTAAAQEGMGVLLDGEGGDELFGCEPFLLADLLRAGDVRGAVRLAHRVPGMGRRLERRTLRVLARKWVLPAILPPRAMSIGRRLARRPPPVPAWLNVVGRAAAVGAAGEVPWRAAAGPYWRRHLEWMLTDARAAMGVQDLLRRFDVMAGVRTAHPFVEDVELVELVLGLPPEHAFDRRHDRPLLRRSMRGLAAEAVLAREDKVYFNPLLLEALAGADQDPVQRTLGHDALEIGSVADPLAVCRLWAAGPEHHPHGRLAWANDVWRAFAAETWLRREAGRTPVPR